MNKKDKGMRGVTRAIIFLSKLFALGSFLTLILLIVKLSTTNILPVKVFIPIALIFCVLSLIVFFLSKNKKKKVANAIVSLILSLLIIFVSGFAVLKIDRVMDFLNNNFGVGKSTTSIYNIVVNKKSIFRNSDDVRGKVLHNFKDLDDTSKLEAVVTKELQASVEFEDDLYALAESVIRENETQIILLNEGIYDAVSDSLSDFESTTMIIGQISLEVDKAKDAGTVDDELMKKPFAVFISGIDTREDRMPARSRSDVNIAMFVNPNTRKVLLVAIPRDYYVQLSGTSGLRDKLTHAGALGGVDLSQRTISELLGVEFDKYVRVNFNSVVRLVNAIGGIVVYSDVDHEFNCWTKQDCKIIPGDNYLNGECALAFARERFAYSTGDRHRGENQEQVISVLIRELSKTKNLTRFDAILNALDGAFETNISSESIRGVVQNQIDDGRSWKVETSNLDGAGSMEYTYSYRSQKLYVMVPNQKTIDDARKKIQAIMAE